MIEQAPQDVLSRRILKSASALGLLSLLTLAVSFLREVTIAAKIGAGPDIDAYLVAALYPTFLASIFANTFGSTLVPIYHRTSVDGELARNEYVSAAWTLSVVGITATAVLLAFLLGPLVKLATPGFGSQTRTLTLQMAVVLLPAGVCNGLVAFQAAVLNARKSFIVPALAVPLNAFVIAVAVLFFGQGIGVFAIVYGSFAGAVAGLLLVSIASVRHGVRLRLVRRFWTVTVKRTVRLSAPLLVGVVATFCTLFIDRAMASSLGPGSIAALGYADKVAKIPEAVIMGALPVVLFPYLSQSAHVEDFGDLRNVSTFGLTLMIIILVPVSAFFVVLRGPLIELLFQRGRFDATAAQLTASALSGYALGLTFNGLGYVFPRVLLAVEKSYVIALLGVGNVVLKLAYNTLLIPMFGHAGIALGTSLMYATTDAFFIIALFYYGIGLDFRFLLKGLAFGAGLGGLVVISAIAARSATQNPLERVLSVGIVAAGLAYLAYRSPKLTTRLLPNISKM